MLIGSRGSNPLLAAMGQLPGVAGLLPTIEDGANLTRSAPPVAAPAAAKKRGVLDRIGDFVKSSEGRGALLRSGAVTLDKGLGAGIMAGAGYVDDRHAREDKAAQQQFENGIATRGADLADLRQRQNNDVALMGVALEGDRNRETKRSNMSRERLDRYGTDVASSDRREGYRVQQSEGKADRASREGIAAAGDSTQRYVADRTADARNYGTDARYPVDEQGNPVGAGIGSRGRGGNGSVGKIKIKERPAVDGWFSDTPGVPAQEIDLFPLPANASAQTLIPGRAYQTARGNARWNGSGFDPL